MAKLKMFSYRDGKIESFTAPMFLDHAGMALRMTEDLVNGSKDSTIGKHPEDFTLYEIGEWDSVTCEFFIYQTPKLLGVASEYLKKPVAV